MAKREKVEDFFASGDDFEDYLTEGLNNAEYGSDIDFIIQLRKMWESYGMRGFLSERQYQRLCDLAGGDGA